MVEYEIINTCGANVEVGIVVQNVLHMLLVEFPVDLCSWALHDATMLVKRVGQRGGRDGGRAVTEVTFWNICRFRVSRLSEFNNEIPSRDSPALTSSPAFVRCLGHNQPRPLETER